jgi:hypothetical protein
MKISDFIKSLLPSFDKSRMVDDLDNVKKRLGELMPPLKAIAEIAGDRKFNNEWAAGVNSDFLNKVKMNPKVRGNMYANMYKIMLNVEASIPIIETQITRYFKEEIMKEAMTAVRISILQFIESYGFVIDITGQILLVTMQLEEDAATNATEPSVVAGELNTLASKLNDYYSSMNLLAGPKEDLEKKINSIPDVTIDSENIASVTAVVEAGKLDPFGFGFIGAKLNPIYHIRIAIAEYQTERYRLAKDTKQALELRLLRLKQLDAGKDDAALQLKIRNIEARIEDLSYKIKKMEEAYA